MKRVAVIGLGLLGASFGMSLRGAGYHRIGWARRDSIRKQALNLDIVDEVTETFEDAAATADITIFALPIPQIIEYLEKGAPHWKPGTLVSDMGSVKNVIHQAAEKYLTPRGIVFTGSHPMAGTEKSGLENSFPTLYCNADVFLSAGTLSTEEHFSTLNEIWLKTGARQTVRVEPEEHDDLVAHTSHVLHVVASALALTILGDEDARKKALRFAGCATGFRDTSRIASSNPAMWREIIEHNTEANLLALENFEKALQDYRAMIKSGDFDGFEREFAKGKCLRDSWLEYKNKNN